MAVAQEKLTQAQERTDARLEKLAQAQERTEVKVAELAEAQRHMERAIQQLAEDLRQTREELIQKIDASNAVVGGISATIGYGLEDKAYQSLPGLLQRDFGITMEGPLYRRFVKDNTGQDIGVNIFCAATQAGKQIHIVGEVKSQLSKTKIDEFIRKKLKRLGGVYPDLFPIVITHMISSADVADYAEGQGIHLYYSYQFVP